MFINKNLILFVFFVFSYFSTKGGEIVRISGSTRHLIPEGKEVDAIDGDWILKNDKIIAIIGDAVPGRDANVMVPAIQGAVIDFTSLKANNDNLVAYYPQGYRIGAISAHKIEVIKRKGREIILRVTRNPSEDFPYVSVTEYSLRDGERFLRVKTTHHNTGTENIIFKLADQLRLDHGISDASPIGSHDLVFIYNKWFKGAYGIYCPEGMHVRAKPILWGGRKGGITAGFRETGSGDKLTLKPDERVEVLRFLLCGRDVSELQKNIKGFQKGPGITTLKVRDTNEKPVADAFVEILDQEGAKVSFAITDAKGIAELPLTPGNYQYMITKIGHDTVRHDLVVTEKNRTLSARVKPLTSLTFTVKEAGSSGKLPVMIEFKGVNGTPDPYLGTKNRAEGAENLYYAFNEGPFQVPLPPGIYDITISHGPEYTVYAQQIQVERGENKKLNVELERAYSTPHWIIADFHNHTTRSGDNNSEVRSRIINMAAAGIEFAPATEHNRISSFTQDIKNLKIQNFIASCPGIELSGLPGPGAINHQNAFPLRVQEGVQGGGFPGTDADPYVQMKGLYDYDGGKFKFMQQNHPNIPWLYFDKDQDGVMDQGFGTRAITHAMELNNRAFDILKVTADNATVADKKNKVFYWLQMLNQGDRIYGTANSDNHRVTKGSGAKFNYVYSNEDEPNKIDAMDIAKNAKEGHIIMSNGPFIKTDINGSLPGDDVKVDKSSDLLMKIEVFSPLQNKIDRVQLLVNGRQHELLNFTIADHPQLFSDGPLQFKHTFTLPLEKDANVIVVATGKRSGKKRKAAAVTNPFFIDVDSNGFVANKDLLGRPLPTRKKTGEDEGT